MHRTRPSAGFFIALLEVEEEVIRKQCGRKLNVKLSVSKAELGGSNPSARAKLCYASEAEVDIAQDS
jgi:hypothetical protein